MIDRLELAAKLPENQDPVKQFIINRAIRDLTENDVKDPGWPEVMALDVETPAFVVDLSSELLRQANELTDRFALELSQSRQQYIDGLPLEVEQPEEYKGRLETAVLVQVPTPKLTLARMCDIAGIVNYLNDPKELKDWQKDPGKFKTPETPYLTWLHDGSRNKNRSVTEVRKGLASDERGGTVYDGIALFIQNPNVLKSHYLDLPGSQYGFGSAPCLDFWDGRPELGYDFVDVASPGCGSVVAGRNIITK